MQDQLLEMLMKKDEITWQSLIYDLVRTEQMDPWDIDISLLSKKYLETVRKLKEVNFFISGKVILAAAILLKMKSVKLAEEDILVFDRRLFGKEEEIEEIEQADEDVEIGDADGVILIPKTPHPRKRKISVEDLIGALKKALEVEHRRTMKILREKEITIVIPEKKVDIRQRIRDIYEKIKGFLSTKERLFFSELIKSERKEDKIATFVPLIYLTCQDKIDLEQKEHFGEIEIFLMR